MARLRERFVRAELDESSETTGKKIRFAVTHKIPNVLGVGEREPQDGSITVRRYGSREQTTMSLDAFEEDLLKRIRERTLDRVDWEWLALGVLGARGPRRPGAVTPRRRPTTRRAVGGREPVEAPRALQPSPIPRPPTLQPT